MDGWGGRGWIRRKKTQWGKLRQRQKPGDEATAVATNDPIRWEWGLTGGGERRGGRAKEEDEGGGGIPPCASVAAGAATGLSASSVRAERCPCAAGPLPRRGRCRRRGCRRLARSGGRWTTTVIADEGPVVGEEGEEGQRRQKDQESRIGAGVGPRWFHRLLLRRWSWSGRTSCDGGSGGRWSMATAWTAVRGTCPGETGGRPGSGPTYGWKEPLSRIAMQVGRRKRKKDRYAVFKKDKYNAGREQ